MKNKIADLNNHLFAQLERLGEEGLTDEQIANEGKRTDAIVAVSEQIIKSATLTLGATKLVAEYGVNSKIGETLLPLLEGEPRKLRQ